VTDDRDERPEGRYRNHPKEKVAIIHFARPRISARSDEWSIVMSWKMPAQR
jgi:hypothetical protein